MDRQSHVLDCVAETVDELQDRGLQCGLTNEDKGIVMVWYGHEHNAHCFKVDLKQIYITGNVIVHVMAPKEWRTTFDTTPNGLEEYFVKRRMTCEIPLDEFSSMFDNVILGVLPD